VKEYWLSCPKFTILVKVKPNGNIKYAAPIAKKFIGQKFVRLIDWAAKFGNVDVKEIK
jgi:hypothetical protein